MRPGLPVDESQAWTRAARTWAEVLVREGRTTAVVEVYAKHLGWLAGDHVDQVPDPWALTHEQLSAWLGRQQTWSLSTRRGVLVSLRSFYSWGIRAGLVGVSPLAGVEAAPRAVSGPSRASVPRTWVRPLEEWETFLRAGSRAEATIETRRQQVSTFARHHSDPWGITEMDLVRWLSRTDWSAQHKRTTRSSLRSFYSWAARFGRLAVDPSRELDPVRLRRALPRPAPDDVVSAGLAAADDRVGLMILLGCLAGLRRAEIAGLHTRDIGDADILVLGKGGHERLVPLHPDLAAALRGELERRRVGTNVGNGWGRVVAPIDGWLFPGHDPLHHVSPRWVGKLLTRALTPGWTAHPLRHRFATQAYQVQRDLRAVQELLGHTRPEVTARYAAVPAGAMRAAVAGVQLPA